jgi:hypothetical protein
MSDFRLVKLLDAISITLNGPSFTGEYNNTTTYQIGQSVSYLGSSYVAYVVTTGNLPTNDNYWQLLVDQRINQYDQDPSLPQGVPWIRKVEAISHTLLQIGLTVTAPAYSLKVKNENNETLRVDLQKEV